MLINEHEREVQAKMHIFKIQVMSSVVYCCCVMIWFVSYHNRARTPCSFVYIDVKYELICTDG